MKRNSSIKLILFPMILLFVIQFTVLVPGASSNSYADEVNVSELVNPPQGLAHEITVPNASFQIARSGCCSWHGGVCGCIGGRVVCCDGTFSPTCTCYRDADEDLLESKE